ncbi:RnfABCDGE type electron transport complex subunit D [Escherichia coli]
MRSSKSSIYHGALAGAGWQWVNVTYLVGGLFLLWQKAIRSHIPVSFLVTRPLLNARLAVPPGKRRLAADASTFWRDHAGCVLYCS